LGDYNCIASVLTLPDGILINQLNIGKSIEQIAFRPDGKQVAMLGWYTTVHLWQWNPDDWITEACSRLSRNLTQDEWLAHLREEIYQPTCDNLPLP